MSRASRIHGETTPNELEKLVPQLARKVTGRAFSIAAASTLGATVVQDGWICEIRNGEVVRKIGPAPRPTKVRRGQIYSL